MTAIGPLIPMNGQSGYAPNLFFDMMHGCSGNVTHIDAVVANDDNKIFFIGAWRSQGGNAWQLVGKYGWEVTGLGRQVM